VTSTTHLQPRRREEAPQPPPRRAPQGPSRVSPVPMQGGYTMHAGTTKRAAQAATSLPADEQVMASDGHRLPLTAKARGACGACSALSAF
jgi:hypothetical protein